MGFVHLHLHTQFSLLDGAIKLDDLFDASVAGGMKAVAMTDHGNLFGAVKFYKMAKEKGIKPIIGSEVYVAPNSRHERVKDGKPSHLILLAMNNEGYRNLCRLSSRSWIEGYYFKPRIDLELLKQHSAGLVCSTACLSGEIPRAILAGDKEKAYRLALQYDAIFGRDNFFLELQYNGIPEQETVNTELLNISELTGIPVLATNDCHYLKQEDAYAHEVLLAIQTGKTMQDTDRMAHATSEFYFKPEAVMAQQFKGLDRALEATERIAARADVSLQLGKPVLPEYKVPEGQTREEYLAGLAQAGVERRMEVGRITDPGLRRQYQERLERELSVINGMGYSGYYLIVWDFISWARKNGVPVGPGRGSGAGSLVAYGLEITDIDPMKYSLLFERFLNPERISLPDFDIDFCKDGRDKVIEYVTNKYGQDRVGQIITYSSLLAKGVIKDVARAMGFSFAESDQITKLIPGDPKITLAKAFAQEPGLGKLLESGDKRYAELFRVAATLEGLHRHSGVHAAGIVISKDPLIETLPLCTNEGTVITQYSKDEAEAVGLVKFDFLGLKTLTVIETALRLIEQTTGQRPDLSLLPLDDPEVYVTIASGQTTGLFQMESSGFRDLLRRLRPDCIEDIIAVLALYRPGPLEGGMVDDYVKGKRGLIKVSYPHPDLVPILKETYGVIVYQEQVMQIASVIAGYSLGRADILRKAISKKKGGDFEAERAPFMEAAAARGYDRAMVTNLFGLIEQFARYGFNKSHSAAYAIVAWQTAWLKTRHPTEFVCALMSCDMDNMGKMAEYVAEARSLGIKVLVPNINTSAHSFSVPAAGEIQVGLGGIKNVGSSAIVAILEERAAHGPFTGLFEFCKRVDLRKVNHRVVESLVKAGAFDSLCRNRKVLLDHLDDVLCEAQKEQKQRDVGQLSLFSGSGCGGRATVLVRLEQESCKEPTPEEIKAALAEEKDVLGYYLSSHPMENYGAEQRSFADCSTLDLVTKVAGEEVTVLGIVTALKEKHQKNGGKMARFQLVDLDGSVEVLAFSKVFEDSAELLKGMEPVLIRGNVLLDTKDAADEPADSIVRLRASHISAITNIRARRTNSVLIRLEEGRHPDDVMPALQEVLKKHRGKKPVRLEVSVPGHGTAVADLGNAWMIKPSDGFSYDMTRLLGADSFLYVT